MWTKSTANDMCGAPCWYSKYRNYRIVDVRGSGIVAANYGRYVIQYRQATKCPSFCALKQQGKWLSFSTLKAAKAFAENTFAV